MFQQILGDRLQNKGTINRTCKLKFSKGVYLMYEY